jgi:hypothetical protein
MIAVFAGLFLLSALITLAVLSSGRSGAAGEVPVSSIEQITGDLLSVQDLILPMRVQEDSAEPYVLRPKLDRWRDEQVSRYWIPLEELALDLVRKENDRRIEALFEEIP